MFFPLAASPQIERTTPPPAGVYYVDAVTQEVEGPLRKLRGGARLETSEMVLYADEIDYNETTAYVEARGNVRFKNYEGAEELFASKVEYYLDEERGVFYDVSGMSPMKMEARPGVLSSTSPFHFEGKWAERLGSRYVLHEGMITNCKLPRPWWTLRGRKFDIIPGDRALAYNATFRVRKAPIFHTPFFYKSLESVPRKSGFLMPTFGNTSLRGTMFGGGYFWAINRSYDATYRGQYFSQRGLAHHTEIRGKPRYGTDFNAIIYGVQDRGQLLENGERDKAPGASIVATGRSELGRGFIARGTLNYLSSLKFRQNFTETFQEAISSEVHSVGTVTKDWSSFSFATVFARIDNFQSAEPDDSIVIRKLPEVQFSSRDRQISEKVLPIWISLQSSAGLLRRTQPLFQTRQFADRVDFQPRITTALYWKGFQLVPSFSARETHYGVRQEDGRIHGGNLNRNSREVFVELITPSLARVFNRRTILGDQIKHVIEPRFSFRHVNGAGEFVEVVRFDENDLVSNTTEAEISLANRFYAKRNGQVTEVLSWELWQRRYFDPTFGGAVVEGRRNVVATAISLTPYAFLDRPRHYSPVVSVLRAMPTPLVGVEWRADYDPLRGQIVNSTFSTDVRAGAWFVSAGHVQVRSVRELSPNASQFRGMIGFGNGDRRGWNAAFTTVYDFRVGSIQYTTTQVTYNTDCCGLSLQYQRFNGVRVDTGIRVAFAIANIGTFGTLKRQERMF